jgi:uncharacterized protein (DUF1330 family)
MPAYVIVDVQVHDPEGYAEYRQLSGASVAQYGGQFLVRGGAVDVAEGDWQPGRFVVIQFPSMEQAKTWYNSPEYTTARAIRQRYSSGNLLFVEGVA